LIEALNRILADSFALYLKSKNFHWHVSGPHFRDYHLLLDEQASQILAITDPIAERIRKRGGSTIRSIGHVSRLQTLNDNDQSTVDAHEMLGELRADNESLIESFGLARALAEKEGDNASSSLLDDWVDEAEERVWLLRQAAAGPGDAG
jgi:starvation-inducible DNA-binding protein